MRWGVTAGADYRPAPTLAWRWKRLVALARRNPAGAVSLGMILFIALVAILAPWLAPHDPSALGVGPRLSKPSLTYPFGTDNLGRDLLSRIIAGTRTALIVSSASVSLGVLVGTALGLVSGWFRGLVDDALQRLIDSLMAIPPLVLAMALVAVLGPGLWKLLLALAIFLLPAAARTVRGAVLSAREEVYVEAARAIGAPTLRILLRHILPNVTAPIIIVVTVHIGAVIISEAALSFVGLGIQPPMVSWGQMLSLARPFMESAPWLVAFPTGAIALTVLAFNFLGDALRDIWDPRLRGST
ncbi:Glutathione transport system permease protein GsiD [bacterium HR23]|nr:Glutathione transport system permease protein GsiD [bacterium HR23]